MPRSPASEARRMRRSPKTASALASSQRSLSIVSGSASCWARYSSTSSFDVSVLPTPFCRRRCSSARSSASAASRSEESLPAASVSSPDRQSGTRLRPYRAAVDRALLELEDLTLLHRRSLPFACRIGVIVSAVKQAGPRPLSNQATGLSRRRAPRTAVRIDACAGVPSRAGVWDCSCVAIASDLVSYFAQREPIFHGTAWPRRRAELERLVTGDFWEVGASGAVYTREHVLDSVVGSVDEMDNSWRVDDLECRELADGAITVTYLLQQPERRTDG